MKAEIITIGDEILIGQIIDTNSSAVAQIYLYAPAGIQFSDTLAYDSAEMSAVVSALQSAADASSEGNQSKVETTGNVLGSVITSQVRKSGIGQQAALQLGVVRNPRLEMLFRAPGLRQLSLTWKFMPSNASESAVVEGLIKRKPNPNDGRGVLVHLTKFGVTSREKARERVLMFNDSIHSNISKEKINSFFEVSELINNLIGNKLIFTENKENAK